MLGVGVLQYPGEKEITFPPFTCLEADGDPRVERNQAGEIVVFPLKVTLPPPHITIPPHPTFSNAAAAQSISQSRLGCATAWRFFVIAAHT